jgi:hypothetical protein
VVLACTVACSGTPAKSATPPERPATAAGAFADAVQLVLAVHPAPYRFVSREALDEIMEAETIRLRSDDDADQLDLGRALHRVFAAIGDFHMFVGLPLYQQTEPLSLLPVLPVRIGDATYVDASAPPLPFDTELVSIDGIAIDELYTTLEQLVVADGRNPTALRRQLEQHFGKFFHLQYGLNASYTLVVRHADGRAETIHAPGIGREQLGGMQRDRHSDPRSGGHVAAGEMPWPTVRSLEEGVHVLRAPSFGILETDEYATRAHGLLDGLSGARALIIDVRGNPGGSRTNAIAILERIMPAPYRQWDSMSVRVTEVPDPYRDYITFPFGSDTERLVPAFRDGLVLTGDPIEHMMTAAGPRFDGRVVVLANGLTNSAANSFVLALAAYADDVMIVGEELGGGCARHIGELPLVYQLSALDVVVMMSLIDIDHVDVPGCAPGRGYVPPEQIAYTFDDYANGIDPYMRRALELLSAP